MNVNRKMRTGGSLASFVVTANVVRRTRKTRTTCQHGDARTDLRSEIEVAVRAVRSACRVCLKVLLTSEVSLPRTPVLRSLVGSSLILKDGAFSGSRRCDSMYD